MSSDTKNKDSSGGLTALATQIAKAGGPTKWAYARITEFLLALVVGTATNIADQIAGAFGAITGSIDYAGDQAGKAFAFTAGSAEWLIGGVFDVLTTIGTMAGPLSPVVYVVVMVALAAIMWRLINAVADAIPVVSGIQTFLTG